MRIVTLTPGTGNFFCGNCLREQALAVALRKRGHDVTLVPMYLPRVTEDGEEAGGGDGVPIFFGGVTCYLEQKCACFGRMPRWLDRALNAPALLKQLARFSGMTRARELGEMTLSMLRGEEGRQAVELAKLITWLKTQPRPDAIGLSSLLLVGLARRLGAAFHAPVICTMQGEDAFLDSLPEPYRQRCWQLVTERGADVARFVTGSRYYRDLICARTGWSNERVAIVPNGITLDGFGPGTPPAIPTIGFLARMIEGKGLGILVDAFLELRKRNRVPEVRLRLAGTTTPADQRYIRRQKEKLAAAGLTDAVDWLPNVSRADKIAFLQGLTVLSVPATYGESYGLYLIEAWACGVPVVQPRHAAFPELMAATGGGVLCEPNNPTALADALETLLLDPARARALGAKGRLAVEQGYSAERMAQHVEEALERG
jgi:glycosyltransferase involved in cell wall biosynthesis